MRYKNPVPTVDIIIEIKREGRDEGIVLIKRKNPPHGWALPGGFVDYGESLEDAALREAKEETTLDIELRGQFHTYSSPDRDPRGHTISTVFVASAGGTPEARDDAEDIGVFPADGIRLPLAFDHRKILDDYIACKRGRSPMDEDKKTPEKPDPDSALKEICSAWGLTEADVVKSYLEANGISCSFQGRMLQAIYPFTVDGLGEIKIMVLEKDYDLAKELLSNMPEPEKPDESGTEET